MTRTHPAERRRWDEEEESSDEGSSSNTDEGKKTNWNAYDCTCICTCINNKNKLWTEKFVNVLALNCQKNSTVLHRFALEEKGCKQVSQAPFR